MILPQQKIAAGTTLGAVTEYIEAPDNVAVKVDVVRLYNGGADTTVAAYRHVAGVTAVTADQIMSLSILANAREVLLNFEDLKPGEALSFQASAAVNISLTWRTVQPDTLT